MVRSSFSRARPASQLTRGLARGAFASDYRILSPPTPPTRRPARPYGGDMTVTEASPATAVEAWDARWATDEGRADWLEPHPDVVALLPELKLRGARRSLDLG